VIVSRGLIVTVNVCVADCGGLLLSVTRTVKFAVPTAVGVPLIAPVPALSVNPAGNAPALSDHAYGCVPCCAETDAE
jgi:hypothetical protein